MGIVCTLYTCRQRPKPLETLCTTTIYCCQPLDQEAAPTSRQKKMHIFHPQVHQSGDTQPRSPPHPEKWATPANTLLSLEIELGVSAKSVPAPHQWKNTTATTEGEAGAKGSTLVLRHEVTIPYHMCIATSHMRSGPHPRHPPEAYPPPSPIPG